MKSTIVTIRLMELEEQMGFWINWDVKPTIAQIATITKNLEHSEKIELTEKQIKRFEANEVKKVLYKENGIIVYKIGTKICMHVFNVYQRIL